MGDGRFLHFALIAVLALLAASVAQPYVMRLLLTVVRSEGITALVATHDEALMDLADDVLRLEDGRIGPG